MILPPTTNKPTSISEQPAKQPEQPKEEPEQPARPCKTRHKQWVKFAIVTALYLAFLYWVESWLGLLVIPFIYDVYISKKIKWGWWKSAKSPAVRSIMSWVDAIVFALIGVYFLNQFFFQNYVIPSSSLEKTLLTGDYLLVSKLSYGPRIPQTPLTMPLTQNTLPILGIVGVGVNPYRVFAALKHAAQYGCQRPRAQLGVGHRQHVGLQATVRHIPVEVVGTPMRVKPFLVKTLRVRCHGGHI